MTASFAPPTPNSPTRLPDPTGEGSEDVLALWSDLESGVSTLLRHPRQVHDFSVKLRQYETWLRSLLAMDVDAGLYVLFQLTATSAAGYSASHAVICAALCEVISDQLRLPADERSTLVRAALTMNIGMTALQDALALQLEPPAAAQRQHIDGHARASADLLAELGADDRLLLDTIMLHHANAAGRGPLSGLPPPARLGQVLHTIDRYAALVSPRSTREGRSPLDSARAILQARAGLQDEAGAALVAAVGLFPPGTLVLLDSDETAVVVRRGVGAAPMVAVVRDARARLVYPPRLHDIALAAPGIRHALVARRAAPQIDHRHWLQVGVMAWRQLSERQRAQGSGRARSRPASGAA